MRTLTYESIAFERAIVIVVELDAWLTGVERFGNDAELGEDIVQLLRIDVFRERGDIDSGIDSFPRLLLLGFLLLARFAIRRALAHLSAFHLQYVSKGLKNLPRQLTSCPSAFLFLRSTAGSLSSTPSTLYACRCCSIKASSI